MYRCLRAVSGLALVLAVTALACSTDRDSPLGSELTDDILGTRPGTVFSDSLPVLDDTTFTYHSLINTEVLEIGRQDGFRRTVLVHPDLGPAAADTLRVVTDAKLRLVYVDQTNTVQLAIRLYELGTPFTEADSVAVLDTTQVILDPTTGLADRVLENTQTTYALPPALVQSWIRGEKPNNGIAIVYVGGVDRVTQLNARSATSGRPLLDVTYQSGSPRTLTMADDATFVESIGPQPQLVIGDGVVRRVHFRFDTGAFPDSAAVHSARVRFYYQPGTGYGTDFNTLVFVPDATDPAAGAFLSGIQVTAALLDTSETFVELPVTLTLLGVLSGAVKDNGFTLRFVDENVEIRQIGFYGSSAPDSLRPRLFFTASTPGTFSK